MKTRLILVIASIFLAGFISAQDNKASVQLAAAIYEEEVTGNLGKAVELYLDILKKYPDDRPVAAKTLYHLGLVNEKMGEKKANEYFTRVVSTYPDQTEVVTLAKARLAALASSGGTAVTKGPITRRILADASGVRGVLTANGKYICNLERNTGDVVQFEIANGRTSQIKNKGPWEGFDKSYDYFVLSHDGKQIAYNSLSDTINWNFEVRIRNLDGSGLRTLYSKKDYVEPQDWSPDAGSILAYRYGDEATDLMAISTTDGSERVLRNVTSVDISSQKARFSPDGRSVAFSSTSEGSPPHLDVFVMTTENLNEVIVAGHPAEDRFLAWTPDGRGIVFRSDRSGTWDIWIVRITGGKQQGEPELLKKDFGLDTKVYGFAPDGFLYYKAVTPFGSLYEGAIDLETGKVLIPPSKVTMRYTDTPGETRWSPDGRDLAYTSRGGPAVPGYNILTIWSAATREERFLSPPLLSVQKYSWAPDGRSLIAFGQTDEGTGIFRIDAETSGITKLAGENHFAPHLCPDGKTLVFSKRGPIIMKRNLDTGEESEVTKIDPTQMGYDLSPDGREVVFQVDHVVKILSLDGGQLRELFRGLVKDTSGWWEYDLRWTMDGRHIIARAGTEIWRVPAQGGTPLKLDLSVSKMASFELNPDNRHFAFSVNDGTKEELWVLENFLPEYESEENDQLTLRKLDYPQLNTPFARLSPDGKKIAYAAGELIKSINILDLGSGTEQVLVEGDVGGQSSMVWSPQGDKIAYTAGGKELYIRDVDGRNSKVLLKNSGDMIYPTDWSQDGKKILCFFEGDDWTIRIGTVTSDSQVKFLASGNSHEFSSEPKISPDGAYVACAMEDEACNRDIYIWTSDGSRKERVTEHPSRDENPVWSPDGKYIAFLSDRNRSVDLWGVQIKDGKAVGSPFIIKQDLGWRTRINDLTAGGKLFMLTLGGAEPANLFTIPVDQAKGSLSGNIVPISVYPTDHFFPRYSPDGKMIAYTSRKGQIGLPKLFVMDEKGVEKELPLHGHFATNIAWHPGNRSLFFTGLDKTFSTGVFEVSLDKDEIRPVFGSETVEMKTFKGGLININLLPDAGKMMFFRLLGEEYVEVLTFDPDGQQLTVVLPRVKMPLWGSPSPTGDHICYRIGDSLMVVSVTNGATKFIGASTRNLEATWAPDGESLMFREGSSLKIFSVKENTARTLYKAAAGKTIGGMEMYANSWSPDGIRFIFTERDTSMSSTSPQKLILINPDDGSFSELGDAPKGYRMSELRWSPDGSRLVATGKSISSEPAPRYNYWILENFLPE